MPKNSRLNNPEIPIQLKPMQRNGAVRRQKIIKAPTPCWESEEHLSRAINSVNEFMGDGYAHAHPELVAAVMQENAAERRHDWLKEAVQEIATDLFRENVGVFDKIIAALEALDPDGTTINVVQKTSKMRKRLVDHTGRPFRYSELNPPVQKP